MSNSLLLVDDDKDVLDINKKYFINLGYDVAVAASGQAAKDLIMAKGFDCIVLDVMMPEMDGFALCKWIKTTVDTPVLFLTGKTSEDDKIEGLLLGGDDYMIKPYSLRELAARIQVLMRRFSYTVGADQKLISYPPLTLNLLSQKAFFEDKEIALAKKEYEFLLLLAKNPGQVFSFEEIGNAIWGGYIDSDRKTIMVTASRLRKKLDAYTGLEGCVETVWSKGYKFVKR